MPPADANPFGSPTSAQTPAPAFAEAPAFAAPADPAPANPFGGAASQPAQAAAPTFTDPAPAPAFAAAPAFGAPAAAQAEASPFGAPAGGAPFSAPAYTNPVGPAASPFTPAAAQHPGGMAAPAMRPLHEAAVHAPARRGYVITVTAPKGGTGKSSLSLNLAAYLGLRLQGTGKNVALIDANVQQADAGKYLNAWTPNIEDVMRDTSAIHPDHINKYLLHRNDLNLSVLLGPMTPDTAHPVYFSGKKYAQILDAMRPSYDYLIIDTPVAEFYHDIFQDFALPKANFILVAVTPNYTTVMNTDAWLRQVCAPVNSRGMGIDPANVGVVLNRAEEDIGFTEEEVIRDLGPWPYLGAIPETKEWKKANNKGQLVATENYHELNAAFNNILFQATRDELLATSPANLAPTNQGIGDKLRGMFKKKG